MLHEEKLDLPLSKETLKAKWYPQKIVIITYDFGQIEYFVSYEYFHDIQWSLNCDIVIQNIKQNMFTLWHDFEFYVHSK